MFTVYMVDGNPGHIYFVNSDDLGKVLLDRNLDGSDIKWQELSFEALLRLKDRDYKLLTVCLK